MSKEFAAAEVIEATLPIRPMSDPGRASLRSSGGSESYVLCRAKIGKHGQPRWPGAHGPDASGNPAKLGAPIERVEGSHPDAYDLKDWASDAKGCWELAISELAKRVTQPSVYRDRQGREPSKVYGSKNPSMENAE